MNRITVIILIFLVMFPKKIYAQYEKYFQLQSADEAIKIIDNDIIDLYRDYGLDYKADLMDKLEYRFIEKGNITGFIKFKSDTFNRFFQVLSIVYDGNYELNYKSNLVQYLHNDIFDPYFDSGNLNIEKLVSLRECISNNISYRHYYNNIFKNYKQFNLINENPYRKIMENNWKSCLLPAWKQYSSNDNYLNYFKGVKINIIPSNDFIVGVNEKSRVLKMSIEYFNQLIRSIEVTSQGYLGLEAIKAYAYNDVDKLEIIINNMNEYYEYNIENINRLSRSDNDYSLSPDLENKLRNSNTIEDVAKNLQLLKDDMVMITNNKLESLESMEDTLYKKYNIYYDLMSIYFSLNYIVFMHEMAHADGYVLRGSYGNKNCDESFESRIDEYAFNKINELMEESLNVNSIKSMFEDTSDYRIEEFGNDSIEMEFEIINNDIEGINSYLILDILSSYYGFIQKIPIKSECQRRSIKNRLEYIDREIKEKCNFLENYAENGEVNKDLLNLFQKRCL